MEAILIQHWYNSLNKQLCIYLVSPLDIDNVSFYSLGLEKQIEINQLLQRNTDVFLLIYEESVC